ncbi:uncharacterized protein LOC112460409 isoform X1 [Temnothorax curvispinosus]|uniref:Uncharacterized protein LOC112460409 isoform X1 n=1 Tax=Temnothorax curvispinosus TaxID=300111 RepID=A0A6J1QJV0_9HYME|nr:uncharacterized protein LOC112460409 isoform X1 [Temnothorax curvispinosus]
MVITCAVPKCKSGYKSQKEKLSMFKVPRNIEMRKWEAVIPGVVAFKETYFICEKHFEGHYIIRNYIKHDANGKIIANVPFQRPRLHSSAVPTIFDDNTSCIYNKVELVPELVHTTESHQSIIRTSDEVTRKRPRIGLASDKVATKRPRINLASDEVTTRPCIDFGDDSIYNKVELVPELVHTTESHQSIIGTSDEVTTKRPRIGLASDEVATKRPRINLASDEVTTRPCIDFGDKIVHVELSSCDQQKSSEKASAEVEVSMSVNDRSYLTFAIDQKIIKNNIRREQRGKICEISSTNKRKVGCKLGV